MRTKLEELKICYIEQFGFDLIIGSMRGLELGTIMRLREIIEEGVIDLKWEQKI